MPAGEPEVRNDAMKRFDDRLEAARLLADVLVAKAHRDAVVLALPRGGVPLAAEIARRLDAPLDVILVRKIGVPHRPELAVAAVVNGDHPKIVVNEDVAAMSGLDEKAIKRLADVQLAEIRRRRTLYRAGREQVPIKGRTAIVVDDGIATGATVRASLKAIRRREPQRIILAVPVAPASTLTRLEDLVDEIICLYTPDPFLAVGACYREFDQVSDAEVVRLLELQPEGNCRAK
jgi:putative phosphoribosyl transferase